jgi:site-specific DNA-cytosine methylase
MRECTLVDTLSFHKHKVYDTWVSNFEKLSYAHDHFLVNYNGHNIKINDARFTRVGVQRDHMAIQLNTKIKNWKPSKQGRRNKKITKNNKTKIGYKVLKKHSEKQEAYGNHEICN